MPLAAKPARPLARDEALVAVQAGATLVAGSDRLTRVLRRAYNERRHGAGEQAWPSPAIHSWNVWIDRLWNELRYRFPQPAPIRLTAEQESILWENAIRHDPRRGDLLAIEATAEAALQAAATLVEWRLPLSDLTKSAIDEVRSFVRWRREVEDRCGRKGWISARAAVDLLIERLGELPPVELILAGFDELSPQQKELLDAVALTGRIRTMAAPNAESSRASRVSLESPREEIRAAARWAKRLVERGEPGRIGVIVANLPARRQQVERAFLEEFSEASLLLDADADPGFVISVGLPFDRYALVHGALLALELDPSGTDLATFGGWLRCQAIAGGEAERNARGLLDRLLREKGVARIQPHRQGGRLDAAPLLRQALRRWARLYRRVPESQPPARWAETFSRLLDALGWPGEAASSDEGRQVLARWKQLLGELASLGAVEDSWDMPAARRMLTRLARTTPFQPETPDARVEVMSLLESAGAELDHLWVAGLDDESWPPPPRPNPFLPLQLQRELELPHGSVERELEFARLKTDRLLAAAPLVVLSHARAVEDRELGPSPLVAQVDEASVDEAAGEPPESLLRRLWRAARVESVEDAAGPPAPRGERTPGGAKIFEHQAHCPFRAFAEHRLGARKLETAAPGLAPSERGRLVHEALEHIWGNLQSSEELASRNAGALRETVLAGIDHAIEQLVAMRRSALPRRFEQVERERLEELLAAWLEVEREHRTDAFAVVERETRTRVEVGGVAADVRVDRIDALADGRRVIVDYKTGLTHPKEWDRERPLEPQIPLYAVTHEGSLGGALFAKLRADGLKFQGAVARDVRVKGVGARNDPDLQNRVAQWRENLEALAADFLAGRAEVDPRDGKCRYCKLPALCRKDDAP